VSQRPLDQAELYHTFGSAAARPMSPWGQSLPGAIRGHVLRVRFVPKRTFDGGAETVTYGVLVQRHFLVSGSDIVAGVNDLYAAGSALLRCP
jgi:hypothetical protein